MRSHKIFLSSRFLSHKIFSPRHNNREARKITKPDNLCDWFIRFLCEINRKKYIGIEKNNDLSSNFVFCCLPTNLFWTSNHYFRRSFYIDRINIIWYPKILFPRGWEQQKMTSLILERIFSQPFLTSVFLIYYCKKQYNLKENQVVLTWWIVEKQGGGR